MYVLSTGSQWRYVPKDLPPKSTLFGYFDLWNWDGTLDRIHHALYVKCREAMDRAASPAACVIALISRRGNASASRRRSRRSSKNLAKTSKSSSHRPVAPRSRIHRFSKILAPLMPKAGPLADKYEHAVGMA